MCIWMYLCVCTYHISTFNLVLYCFYLFAFSLSHLWKEDGIWDICKKFFCAKKSRRKCKTKRYKSICVDCCARTRVRHHDVLLMCFCVYEKKRKKESSNSIGMRIEIRLFPWTQSVFNETTGEEKNGAKIVITKKYHHLHRYRIHIYISRHLCVRSYICTQSHPHKYTFMFEEKKKS